MSQTLRPDSNVQQTNVVGGYADIDETVASDADFVASNSSTIGTLVAGLSNPSGTPSAGTSTIRYRAAKVGTGSLTITVALLEGTTVIDTAAAQSLTTTYTDYSWNPDTSGVSNWTNVRLRARFSADAAATGRLSWMEMEVPNPALSLVCNSGSFAATGAAVTLSAPKKLTASAGSFALTGADVTLSKSQRFITALSGAFAMAGADVSLVVARKLTMGSGAFVLTLTAATPAKGIGIAALAATFTLTGADLEMSMTARTYYFEGRPKPLSSFHRRLSVRSNHRWR